MLGIKSKSFINDINWKFRMWCKTEIRNVSGIFVPLSAFFLEFYYHGKKCLFNQNEALEN